MTDPPMLLDLIRARDAWRATLLTDYQDTAARLRSAYTAVDARLRARLGDLVDDLDRLDEISPERVRGLRTYAELLNRVEVEMSAFTRQSGTLARGLSERAIVHGADAAYEMAALQAASVRGAWMHPDPDMLQRLLAYADSPAFAARAAQFGPDAARNFGDTLLALTAQGKGSDFIAREMRDWFALPYSWADNQVRTMQMYSYRGASHAAYAANPRVVESWMWWASIGDTRTCMSCIAQHGSVHPVTEQLIDHHRGRCSPLPVVTGTTWAASVQTGPEWFAGQDAATQRRMLGPTLMDLYARGRLNVAEMSSHYHDDIYGDMMREATVGEMRLRRTG